MALRSAAGGPRLRSSPRATHRQSACFRNASPRPWPSGTPPIWPSALRAIAGFAEWLGSAARAFLRGGLPPDFFGFLRFFRSRSPCDCDPASARPRSIHVAVGESHRLDLNIESAGRRWRSALARAMIAFHAVDLAARDDRAARRSETRRARGRRTSIPRLGRRDAHHAQEITGGARVVLTFFARLTNSIPILNISAARPAVISSVEPFFRGRPRPSFRFSILATTIALWLSSRWRRLRLRLIT